LPSRAVMITGASLLINGLDRALESGLSMRAFAIRPPSVLRRSPLS
jgi:hypothetical protein